MTATAATFTIIIPTHDRAEEVGHQVDRLLGEEARPDQLIVVADGCQDDTVARLEARRSTATDAGVDLVVLTTDGVGPASARNAGAHRASGDWLIFLDDDDRPGPAWMSTWRELASSHPAAAHLSVPYTVEAQGTSTLRPVRPLGPAFSNVRASYLAGMSAVRRDRFAAVGGFAEGLRYLECTELALRLFAHLVAEGDELSHGTEPTIVLVARPPDERGSVRPEVLVPSLRQAHRTMEPHLRRDPKLHANTLARLGLAELRMGDRTAARRTLMRAARVAPRSPVHLGRALLSWVPGIGRTSWAGGRSAARPPATGDLGSAPGSTGRPTSSSGGTGPAMQHRTDRYEIVP